MKKAVQYFTEEYVSHCKKLSPMQIIKFLDDYQRLFYEASLRSKTKSRLISIKVPEDLLGTFKVRCEAEGIPYQTKIKELMKEWLLT